MKKQFVWIALLMVSYLHMAGQSQSCCVKSPICQIQTCASTATATASATDAKAETPIGCTALKTEDGKMTESVSLIPAAAKVTTLSVASYVMNFAVIAFESLKAWCDPSTCDPSKCDPSKCDPSKCDPASCVAVSK